MNVEGTWHATSLPHVLKLSVEKLLSVVGFLEGLGVDVPSRGLPAQHQTTDHTCSQSD